MKFRRHNPMNPLIFEDYNYSGLYGFNRSSIINRTIRWLLDREQRENQDMLGYLCHICLSICFCLKRTLGIRIKYRGRLIRDYYYSCNKAIRWLLDRETHNRNIVGYLCHLCLNFYFFLIDISWKIRTEVSYTLYRLSLPSTKALIKDCILGLLMLIFMFVFWNGFFGKIAGLSGAALAIGNIVIWIFGMIGMIISIIEYEQGFYDRYNKKI